MKQLLCSTGALITSKNGRDHRLIGEAARTLSCDGFEFMMYPSWYEEWEKITEDLVAMQIPIETFHVDKGIGELISRSKEGDVALAREQFHKNCEMAKHMGAKLLVLHLWGGMASDRCIANNIREYGTLVKIAKEYGLLLTVENIPCNCEEPLKHWKALHEAYPDVAFTFDVRFAAFHGQIEEFFAKENAWLWKGAVRHVHIGDFAGAPMDWGLLRKCLHPGEGKIDFSRVFERLEAVGYDGTVTVESTSVAEDGSLCYDRLEKTFAFLRSLTNA